MSLYRPEELEEFRRRMAVTRERHQQESQQNALGLVRVFAPRRFDPGTGEETTRPEVFGGLNWW